MAAPRDPGVVNADSGERLSAWTGLALAAVAAAWWLANTRLALDAGADPASAATQALEALWHSRGIVAALAAVRVAALRGWRAGCVAALAVVLPAWPVELLAWSASDVPATRVVVAECALLGMAVAAPLVGAALRRLFDAKGQTLVAATGVAAAMGMIFWIAPAPWGNPFA
jgi:hypothetical protein